MYPVGQKYKSLLGPFLLFGFRSKFCAAEWDEWSAGTEVLLHWWIYLKFGAFVTVVVICTDSKTHNTTWLVTGHSCDVWVRIKCELESILCWVCSCSSVCTQVFVCYSAIESCSSTAQPALNSKGVWLPSSEGKPAARLGHTCPYCCRVSPGLEMC